MKTGHQKSEARLAIEAVLSKATTANPISAQQIADAVQIPVKKVRNILSMLVDECQAHSNRDGSIGWYVNGPRPEPVKSGEYAQPRRPDTFAPLVVRPQTPARAGSMRAYEIPSLGDEVRKRPVIIGARVEAVGGHGGWR